MTTYDDTIIWTDDDGDEQGRTDAMSDGNNVKMSPRANRRTTGTIPGGLRRFSADPMTVARVEQTQTKPARVGRHAVRCRKAATTKASGAQQSASAKDLLFRGTLLQHSALALKCAKFWTGVEVHRSRLGCACFVFL